MDAIIILQAGKFTDPGQAWAMGPVFTEYEFCMQDWDSGAIPNILDTAELKEPTRFYSRRGDLDLVDKVMKAARAQHVLATVHLDAASNGGAGSGDTHEGGQMDLPAPRNCPWSFRGKRRCKS